MNLNSKNIYNLIAEIADLNLQRKLWLNKDNDTGLISSYNEVMCTLFDDYGFDEFLEQASIESGISENTVKELFKLRELLNSYVEKETDIEILNDSEWKKITKQAKEIIKKWH
ncbi:MULTISPECIES: hypothetical protein [Leptospira]|uniref:Uncharacterized protein n=4 Tax=Leptospira TaxID=171 RepID=A0A829CZ17_LEPIR|nr:MULTISPECIES: hypothetical protein [Leptospira]EMF73941.1 hypothetical protein LEP1GSC148_0003 [Leptospira interrogans serovar Canicola str. LT1962]EMY04724.1 hypothetical protein LEP1GSC029_1298 [Leptospira interrogans str. 2002000626]EMY25743.1 hypothetical protein LEP1GSC115_0924 [Leptospira interrogans serovar Australis str. 200703203]EKQ39866.1 hypothetical protein LEP1GSC025_4837 [Leptospira interrogans str. 2002000621]EKQ49778.1 hypothetical protein LEP1GSC026_1189 [Leptospira interr